MKRVQAVILDVDGVIIGEKIGYNSPHPHPEVTEALKSVRRSGIPIVLCTAKPHFSIVKEIRDSGLRNIHITDGGAVITNPIESVVSKMHVLDADISTGLLDAFVDDGIYVEFYDQHDYYMQRDQLSSITKQHTHILQRSPVVTDAVSEHSRGRAVTKIMPVVSGEDAKAQVERICETFEDDITLSWGVHPVALPLQFGIITAKGISKKEGASEAVQALGVPFDAVLGVGDSLSDWQFLESCGYVATLENGNQELKRKITSKGTKKSYVGPSVDDNGIMKILRHFELL